MRIHCDSGLVIEVEPGDRVSLVSGLVASLSGNASSEHTLDCDTHFEIQVQTPPDRMPFRIIVPKSAGIDTDLLALCTAYCQQA